MPPDAPARTRLSVVETVYFQRAGEQPTSVESRFGIDSASINSPLSRSWILSGGWEPLFPEGFPSPHSMLVVQVAAVKHPAMPSAEEKLLAAGRRVVLGFGRKPAEKPATHRTQWDAPRVAWSPEPVIEIGPGESARFNPSDLGALWLRALTPGVIVTVTVMPG